MLFQVWNNMCTLIRFDMKPNVHYLISIQTSIKIVPTKGIVASNTQEPAVAETISELNYHHILCSEATENSLQHISCDKLPSDLGNTALEKIQIHGKRLSQKRDYQKNRSIINNPCWIYCNILFNIQNTLITTY